MAMADVAPRIKTFFGGGTGGLYKRRHPLPKGGVEMRVDVTRKILPLGIKGLELRRGHPGVLGRIQPAAVLQSDICQTVQQVEAHILANRKIQSQGNAWLGEGE